VASTLMSEFAPARIRGRVVVWLEAFWALGWILAAVIGTFVAASGPTGWRWALAVGLVPAIYSLVIRLGTPESVRFLEAQGRSEDAERVVRSFEAAAGIAAGADAGADVPMGGPGARSGTPAAAGVPDRDRKSTRLNSSHVSISYAVSCLKKQKKHTYCDQ